MDYTLHLGDCLEVMATMPNMSVDAIITDPPYGIDYQCARRIDKNARFPKIKNDKGPFVWFLPFSVSHLKDAGCALVFCRWDTQEAFRTAMEWAGLKVNSQIIWNRLAHGAGDLHGSPAPMHDNIWFGRMPKYRHHGARPKSVINAMRVAANNLVHPNEKPLELMKDLVEQYCPPGGIVLDPFMGSGTTGVAAMQTGRKFIGIELDPEYFAIAEKRIHEAATPLQPALMEAAD